LIEIKLQVNFLRIVVGSFLSNQFHISLFISETLT